MSDLQLSRRALLGVGFGSLCGFASRPALADLTAEHEVATRLAWRSDALLPSQIGLGRHLIEHLAGRAGINVMVSPASLAAVLTMLSSGASGPFRHAIHHVLGFNDVSHRKSSHHIFELKAAIGYILRQAGGESPLALANMIVFDPHSKPYQQALAKLTVEGADVSVEDLRKAETIKKINEWVATQTRNLIPSILNDPLSHPGLVALNALYFKDKWKVPFDPTQTKMEKFHLVGGLSVDASMMYSPDGRYRFRQNDRFIATELSYASDDFKLVVVTTKTHPARAREFTDVAGWLGGGGFIEQDGLVALNRAGFAGGSKS
jgi:serpin B